MEEKMVIVDLGRTRPTPQNNTCLQVGSAGATVEVDYLDKYRIRQRIPRKYIEKRSLASRVRPHSLS
jgi:hypothetical protein